MPMVNGAAGGLRVLDGGGTAPRTWNYVVSYPQNAKGPARKGPTDRLETRNDCELWHQSPPETQCQW